MTETLNTDHPDIEALLGRCALRDAQALRELYAVVAPKLFAMLLRLLRRRELAEDALQDVMVRIWQRAQQYEAYRGRGMSWMISIARNRAIDMLRTQRSVVVMDEVIENTLVDDAQHEALEKSATDKTQTALMDCLNELTQAQRRCIALAYIDGCSHDEIARSTGNALGTVKSWIRRGLSSLKRCLEA